jgi:hypothetical protein
MIVMKNYLSWYKYIPLFVRNIVETNVIVTIRVEVHIFSLL